MLAGVLGEEGKRYQSHDERSSFYPRNTFPSYKTEKVHLSNTIVDGGRNKSIMANLYKESEVVPRKILEKAKRIDMAYNKGGLVYVTDGMDIKTMGARSRRP